MTSDLAVGAEAGTSTHFGHLPRIALGDWPTPIERLTNISENLGIDLWGKRDDVTTFGLGGNKVRKLEFLLGDAIHNGYDTVVTTGGSQSNHARLTAGACARYRLGCHLVLDRGRHPANGNLLLDRLFGAHLHLIDDTDPAAAMREMETVAETLRGERARPVIIPRGGSVPQGAVGYAAMVEELDPQLRARGLDVDVVYVATGSCGTHSGVMAGRAVMGCGWKVQGVSVSRASDLQEPRVRELSAQTLSWLGSEASVEEGAVQVDDRFAGPAYGVPTRETWAAIEMMGRLEGVVLDPVYTGKAFAGLVTHVREGRIAKGSTVLFVHTGGSPALFAYADEAPFAGEA